MLSAIFTFLSGIIGIGLISYGAELIYHPMGYIVPGIFLTWFSYLYASRLPAVEISTAAGGDD